MVHISQRTVRRMQLRKQDAHIRRQNRLASERLQRMMDQFVSEVRSTNEMRASMGLSPAVSKHDQIPALDIPQMTFAKPDNEPWHYNYDTKQYEAVPKQGWWKRHGATVFLASVFGLYLGWVGLNLYWWLRR